MPPLPKVTTKHGDGIENGFSAICGIGYGWPRMPDAVRNYDEKRENRRKVLL